MKTNSPILFLDGGLGTSLEDKYNFKFSNISTPLWSSHLIIGGEDQKTLLACQRDFGSIPVDIIETATYQISVEGFSRTKTPDHPNGIAEEAISQYLDNAVNIAEKAIGRPDAKIAYSLGPYGSCMIPGQEYSGKYDAEHDNEAALQSWWDARLSLIGNLESVDKIGYVTLETIPRLDEITAVRKAMSSTPNIGSDEQKTNRAAVEIRTKPFWIACVFSGDGEALPDGSSVETVVNTMLKRDDRQRQPWGIGINCTKIGKLERLVERFEAAVEGIITNKELDSWPALVLYPDGTNGEIYNTTTQKWEVPAGQTKAELPWEEYLGHIVLAASKRQRWSTILVGGCCKSSHSDIKKLVDFIHAAQDPTPIHS